MSKTLSATIICPHHPPTTNGDKKAVRCKGSFYRACDGRRIRRFLCKVCGRNFSEATSTHEYRQRNRHINEALFILLASNNSMRRSAIISRVARKTVDHRLQYFAKVSADYQEKLLKQLPTAQEIHFDDMETSEHTKMKPLAIPLAVAHPTRIILSFDVASMPAKGLLAEKSRKKYGPRKDERPMAWLRVLSVISRVVAPGVVITSDSHNKYPAVIKEIIPGATHKQVKSRRGAIAGQGELKVGGWDPMFSLNHTAAKLRANICRLIRRTRCTTKLKERLKFHIGLYVMWHNETILAKIEGRSVKFPFPDAA